jgi:hypothetical protein
VAPSWGSIKALLRLYSGASKALLRLCFRRQAAAQLDKRSFAGGSVLAVHAENDFYKLRDSISGKRLKKKKRYEGYQGKSLNSAVIEP